MSHDDDHDSGDEAGSPSAFRPANDSEPRESSPDASGGAWARESLAAVLAMAERGRAEAEAHAATCTARPCERCERFTCRCGAPVDGAKTCRDCDQRAVFDRLMRATRESIPRRFRWTIGADEATLLERVQASPDLVHRALTQPPSTSLIFFGVTGAGKTSLACAMLDAWVRAEPGRRSGAFFIEASDLSRARSRHKLGADEAPDVARAMTCPLLVLDELGGRGENDRDGCITDVVWARTNAELPIWITCGLGAEQQTMHDFAEALARRYDGGFVRRLLDAGKRVQLGRKA